MVYLVDWFIKYRGENLQLKNSRNCFKNVMLAYYRGSSNTASVTAHDTCAVQHCISFERIASSMRHPYRVVSTSQEASCVRAIWHSSQYLGGGTHKCSLGRCSMLLITKESKRILVCLVRYLTMLSVAQIIRCQWYRMKWAHGGSTTNHTWIALESNPGLQD